MVEGQYEGCDTEIDTWDITLRMITQTKHVHMAEVCNNDLLLGKDFN